MVSAERVGINVPRFRILPPAELQHDDIMLSASSRYSAYFSRFKVATPTDRDKVLPYSGITLFTDFHLVT